MEEIKKQAELYAESFRYKVDDVGWYEQKVRDFIAGHKAALHIHNVSKSFYCQQGLGIGGKDCDTQCEYCKED